MPETKADLEARVRELEAENAKLREGRGTTSADLRGLSERGPSEPSFGLSEGERTDLQRQGWSVSPHTGQWRTAAEMGVETDEGVDPNPERPKSGVTTASTSTPAADRDRRDPAADDGADPHQ
ncbi:MAG TPA: hypothetical protein VD864_14995 [Nocardioides sp.]|nr:hypothetical protein [Nocardioides sp.]